MTKKIKVLDTGQRNQTTAFIIRVEPDPKELERQYSKEYYRRPEVIARRKTPAMLARKAEYDRQYHQIPEVKERNRLRHRRYRVEKSRVKVNK